LQKFLKNENKFKRLFGWIGGTVIYFKNKTNDHITKLTVKLNHNKMIRRLATIRRLNNNN
jgi:hypothetical protein